LRHAYAVQAVSFQLWRTFRVADFRLQRVPGKSHRSAGSRSFGNGRALEIGLAELIERADFGRSNFLFRREKARAAMTKQQKLRGHLRQ
jgi:hypothetical protein